MYIGSIFFITYILAHWLPPHNKPYIYKWKNHFSEMKEDVGMSLHEKEGEQEDAYTETGSH